MPRRTCSYIKTNGERCAAAPLRDGPFCFWHSPEKAEDVAEAQRLGGLRRKREKTLALAYDVDGIRDATQVFRILEIALVDTLTLDNGVARNRTLVAIAQAASKVHELSDLEERLASLEATIKSRDDPSPFDRDPE